jgi:outer membrane protein assembly factor BamB
MRTAPIVAVVGAAAIIVSGCTGSAASTPSRAAAVAAKAAKASPPNWPTYHGLRSRSGYYASMPTARSVKVTHRIKLDGAVYASPLAVNHRVFVATENDTVYAYTTGGKRLWRAHLGTPSPASERPCGNIDPLGITGTPVAIGAHLFVSAEFGHPVRHQLIALNQKTGKVTWRRSLDLPGVDKVTMQERGALTFTGGRVWVPFGGLAGDCGQYKGRVVGLAYNGHGKATSYTVPTSREAGIWTPPGPSVDGAGYMYVSVGNGESGVGDKYDHSDSVLKLGSHGRLRDYFSPATWATDNDADLDLGSQGPALVGKWVFIAGKSGTAYVLRRDRLDHIGGQVSKADVCRSFGGTAVVGSTVYVPCTDGVRAVHIDSKGRMHVRWQAAAGISGSPVVGGGRVWSLDQGAGVLHALDPKTGRSRSSVNVGDTSRFATPALYGSRVLVPTMTGLTIARVS